MRSRRPIQAAAGRRGFSLAEIIVSMALIAMLSAAGFAVCYTGVNLQGRSERNLLIWNAAGAVRYSFADAAAEVGVSGEPADKLAFVEAFNRRLAFSLNAREPDVNGFSGPYALTGGAWSIRLVMESQTALVGRPDGDGITESRETIALRGLYMLYDGADASGATYIFRYVYFTRDFELDISVNLRLGTYYFSVSGYAAELNASEGRYAAASDTAVYTAEATFV